ncbi:MAG: DNA polymerase III subunit delta [Armatimonadota bacterium]
MSPNLKTDLPFTLLWGDADVLKQRALRQLINEALDESEREYGLIRLDADEDGLDGIVAEMQSGSLMAPRRLLVVRDITELTNARQKKLATRLTPQPGLMVVMTASKKASESSYGRPPVAADLRRAIEANGQILQFRAPSERDLPGWAVQEMDRIGKSMQYDAANLLCENVAGDIDRLIRELEKLATYVGERFEVTVTDVEAVSVRFSQSDIFSLMDAIGQKDAATALRLLDGVVEEGSDRGEFLGFLGMLARQLRLIWQARYIRQCQVSVGGRQKVPDEIADRLPERHNFVDATSGNKGWLAEKFTKQAAMFSDGQLARAMDRLCQADLALKGGGDARMDERTVVELLIAQLCR